MQVYNMHDTQSFATPKNKLETNWKLLIIEYYVMGFAYIMNNSNCSSLLARISIV